MDIRWADIPGTNGWYQVSNTGLVRSVGHWVEYKDKRKPRFFDGVDPLKPFINPRGYEVYTLHLPDGDRRIVQAQVLVLEAFVGPRPDGMPHCRHLDGDPSNNHVSNLKYGTYEENRADMTAHGRDHYASRDACLWQHEFTERNTIDPHEEWSPNKRVCRACNCAGSALYRNGTDRIREPALFQAVSDIYFEVIDSGRNPRGCMPHEVFMDIWKTVSEQPREEGE